jgi:hypothetical protein
MYVALGISLSKNCYLVHQTAPRVTDASYSQQHVLLALLKCGRLAALHLVLHTLCAHLPFLHQQVLLGLLHERAPLVHADAIRTLACKALLGLSHNQQVKQILGQLQVWPC